MGRSQALTLLAIFATGVGLFLAALEPSLQMAAGTAIQRLLRQPRTAIHRRQCLQQLGNISRAIQNYAARTNGVLPLPHAQPKGVDVSWRVAVLPMFDRSSLYAAYDRSLRWDDSPNDVLAMVKIMGYECPKASVTSGANFRTTYVAVTGEETAWPDDGASFDEISRADGLTNTLLIGERHHDRPVWSEPRDAVLPDADDGLPNIRSSEHADELTVFSSSHGSVSVMFVDGHGSTLSADINPDVLRALLTADGGETIEEGAF